MLRRHTELLYARNGLHILRKTISRIPQEIRILTMAFSNSEAYKIRKYLGYPQVYKQANPRLESALTQVGTDVDAVTDVQNILSSISQVETYLLDALDTAGLKRAEEIEWYPDAGGSSVVVSLNQQANKFCAQLSIIFGVPIQSRIFGVQGYTGDQWKQFNGNSSMGSGNTFEFNLGWR